MQKWQQNLWCVHKYNTTERSNSSSSTPWPQSYRSDTHSSSRVSLVSSLAGMLLLTNTCKTRDASTQTVLNTLL